MLTAGLLALVSAAHALAPEVETAETQWVTGENDACIATLDAYLAQNPNDIEGLWRKARCLYSKGELMAQSMPDSQRVPLYDEVTALGRKVQEMSPGHAAGLHWEATGIGRKATAEGILKSLFVADEVEDAWLGALKDPNFKYRASNDTSSIPGDVYYALGQFYRLVPDWYAVQLLVGTRGDIDKSIDYLRKGVADSPDRKEVAKELGVSLLCKADRQDDEAAKAEGLTWLSKASKMPIKKDSDEVDQQHIPIIITRADDACGYSRDGWEDLSKEAFAKEQGQ